MRSMRVTHRKQKLLTRSVTVKCKLLFSSRRAYKSFFIHLRTKLRIDHYLNNEESDNCRLERVEEHIEYFIEHFSTILHIFQVCRVAFVFV
jgi:hypothetical protein